MKFLLDTLCWLWWMTESQHLSDSARRKIEDPENTILLSAASSWEITIKYTLKKLQLPEPPEVFLPKRLARDTISSLPVEHIHALHAASLPFHHHDPFDRLLISQAQIEQVPFMTVDAQFKPYDIEVIWAG